MDPHDTQELGRRVKLARQWKDWTQRDLALAAGIIEITVSRMELGKSQAARMPTIIALADALGVSLDWLVWGEGEPIRERRSTGVQPVPLSEELREYRKSPEGASIDDDVWSVVEHQCRTLGDPKNVDDYRLMASQARLIKRHAS